MFKQLEGLQHHTTAGAGGPLVSSNCPAQSRVCSRLFRAVQLGFAASKEGSATVFLGNLFQCLITFAVEKPAVSYTETQFPVFQSVPIACCPATRHHQERLGSIVFNPLPGIYIQLQDPSDSPSPGWAVTALTTFPYMSDLQSFNHL